MTLVTGLQLRLPSFARLVTTRTQRRCPLPTFRCSSKPDGEEPLPSEDSSNMLRAFSSRSGASSGAAPSSSSGNSSGSSSSSTRGKGFGKQKADDQDKPSPTDALIQSLGGVSEVNQRVPKSNNMVIGGDQSDDTWRELDEQVNEYPGQRTFKAIGQGGQEFVDSMVACVEKVVGPIHQECVSQRASAKGNYVSVTLSVWVENPDQVLSIYANMKEDPRLKFFF